jgi:hypothetical protein
MSITGFVSGICKTAVYWTCTYNPTTYLANACFFGVCSYYVKPTEKEAPQSHTMEKNGQTHGHNHERRT